MVAALVVAAHVAWSLVAPFALTGRLAQISVIRSSVIVLNDESWIPVAWAPPPRRVKLSPAKTKLVRGALDSLTPGAPTESSVSKPGPPPAEPSSKKARREGPRRPPLPRLLRPPGGPMASVRRELPVYRSRKQVLDALRRPVSLVEGETGCGKSTQVAQFLLEEAARSGRRISIACTQPRRISAIGVAERIAGERGEAVGRGAVGYAVRGDSRQSPRGNALLVCTVGVLLRIMEEDAQLERFDVILVDEVHERSVENDFLLLALRRVLQRQSKAASRRRSAARRRAASSSPAGGKIDEQNRTAGAAARLFELPRLRVCLMSATLDTDLFEVYFAQPLRLKVPRVRLRGRAYPVATRYLEHAIGETAHAVIPTAPWCLNSQASATRVPPECYPSATRVPPECHPSAMRLLYKVAIRSTRCRVASTLAGGSPPRRTERQPGPCGAYAAEQDGRALPKSTLVRAHGDAHARHDSGQR